MKRLFVLTLLVAVMLMNACQKESSFENGGASDGSLQSDVTDDCFPKTLSGSYVEGTALDGNTNQLLVTVNVTKTGTYRIYTDTLNGVYFLATGVFATAGQTAVTLKGFGTPLGAGTFNYQVIYENGDTCMIAIPFLPTGAGGPATFTFDKTGANCSVAGMAGTYVVGTALTSANNVTLSVNVTAIGTYNVTTTAGGMTFTGSGGFPSTGPQLIVLTAQPASTPTTQGDNEFTVTEGASTCNFSITVAPNTGAGAGTLVKDGANNCLPATIAGTYVTGVALTGTNTVQVHVNVTATGPYTISTNTVAGFSFSTAPGSSFAATGNNIPVTLIGSGTPTGSGSHSFTVTFGSSTCTFVIPVAGPPVIDYFPRTTNSNWSYEIDDVANDSFLIRTNSTRTVGANLYNVFMITDDLTQGYDSLGYYRKNGGSYYQFLDIGAGRIGFDDSQWGEYIFLKDDQAVGHTWKSNAYTGNVTDPDPPNTVQTLTIRISFKILQKDIAVAIQTSTGTVTHQNVIVVEERYELKTGPGPDDFTDVTADLDFYFKNYYARGVGLIKFEVLKANNTEEYKEELRRHMVY